MHRENIKIGIIGGTGTGKTFYLAKLVKEHPKPVIVYDMDMNDKWAHLNRVEKHNLGRIISGQHLCIDTDSESVLKWLDGVSNCLLVLEDASKYLANKFPDTFRRIIFASKQRNVDIIMTFHSWRVIHPQIYPNLTGVVIFGTGENIRQAAGSKIPCLEKIEAAANNVEAKRLKNPYVNELVLLK